MRKINRSFIIKPSELDPDRLRLLHQDIQKHYRLPDAERRRRRAPIDTSVFRGRHLTNALDKLFESRCAYCESTVDRGNQRYSHYRPLWGAIGLNDLLDSQDHYGWFAYTWENLLLLCEECEEAKRNFFPVRNGVRALVLSTWKEASRQEEPLLLNPCDDSPRQHLHFSPEGSVLPLTDRGAVTIDLLDLNRQFLVRARRRQFDDVIDLIRMREVKAIRAWASNKLLAYPGALQILVRSLVMTTEKSKPLRALLVRAELVDMVKHLAELPADVLGSALESLARPVSEPVFEASMPAMLREANLRQPRLTKVFIENFKGISNLMLDLDPKATGDSGLSRGIAATMLLGENATGKSSVLQAIALTMMSAVERGRLKLADEDYVSRSPNGWQYSESMPMNVVLTFADGSESFLYIDASTGRLAARQSMSYEVIAYGARRFFKSGREGTRNRSLFDPMAVLADPTHWLQELPAEKFDAVARAMRAILALRKDDAILRHEDGQVQVSAHGRISPIERMSDGYRSLFAMSCDIMRHMLVTFGNLEYARGLVLIDEIDIHLHPRWKMRVIAALRHAMPQVQFIVTTHDPLCLRGMRNGEVQVMYREKSGAINLYDELPDVENLRVEQILTSDFFGLYSTSDPAQEEILTGLAELAAVSEEELDPSQREKRDELLNRYGGIPPLRESRDRQILSEAITRHLRDEAEHDLKRTASMREDSIQTIQEMLARSLS